MCENQFKYGPMLDFREQFHPEDSQLNELAEFMTAHFDEPAELPEKPIPAGYTYLGQFIDHDIALDSATTGERLEPWVRIDPQSISNKRTPFLNLETIYGYDEPSNTGEPRRSELLEPGTAKLKLGETSNDGLVNHVFKDRDLLRRPTGIAIIVDSRNDDNVAVAQTQVAFTRFHNTVVKCLGGGDPSTVFDTAREIVIQHYQRIIVEDYLPRVVKKSVFDAALDAASNDPLRFKFFRLTDRRFPVMPLEFSVGAFRMGHSMIRESYNWNRNFNTHTPASPASIVALTKLTGRCGLTTTNKRRGQLPSEWLVNWNLFYETSAVLDPDLNLAAPINTRIAPSLGQLPSPTQNNCEFTTDGIFRRECSLPAFDLYRTRSLGLPSGQAIARRVLDSEDGILDSERIADLLPESLREPFKGETPFWFYLLAEAEIQEKGATLGEVGSRILAETFLGFLRASPLCLLDPRVERRSIPELDEFADRFGMPQMLHFINKYKDEEYDELDPIKEF